MIESNLGEVEAKVRAMAERAANMKPYTDLVGRVQVAHIQARISQLKMSPDGVPWAPWGGMRQKQRVAKGNASLGLLLDTGGLLGSIRFNSTPVLTEIGTNKPEGAELQNGLYGVPARPFVGWAPGSAAEMETLAIIFLETGSAADPTY
jgi:phage gpG-like protein